MVFAQMILIGYPQTMMNTAIMLLVYCSLRSTRAFLRLVIAIGATSVFALLLSAVQVFPLVELAQESDTVAIAARQRFVHPLLPQHLLTIVHPFLFGDPSRGTYHFSGPGQPRFWENLLYIGAIPLLLFMFFVLKGSKTYGERDALPVRSLVAVALISLLLSLGKFTPLRYLFSIFPLSATRVESRFLVFTHFGLAMLSAVALSRMVAISRRPGVILTIAAIHVAQALWVFQTYHAFGNAKEWMSRPDVVEQLSESVRVVTLIKKMCGGSSLRIKKDGKEKNVNWSPLDRRSARTQTSFLG